MVGAPLVHLGFGKYARADRIYALEPIERERRGPGSRTRVWVEGLREPLIASRSETAITRDMGPGSVVMAGDLAREALDLVRTVAEQAGAVGPLLRREIRAEAGLDIDALERRARTILERLRGGEAGQDALF